MVQIFGEKEKKHYFCNRNKKPLKIKDNEKTVHVFHAVAGNGHDNSISTGK